MSDKDYIEDYIEGDIEDYIEGDIKDVSYVEVFDDYQYMLTAVAVAKIVDVNASTIRTWASYFYSYIHVKRIKGRLCYSSKSVDEFLFIKELSHNKKLTLASIKQVLADSIKGDDVVKEIIKKDPLMFETLSTQIMLQNEKSLNQFMDKILSRFEDFTNDLTDKVLEETSNMVQDVMDDKINELKTSLSSQIDENINSLEDMVKTEFINQSRKIEEDLLSVQSKEHIRTDELTKALKASLEMSNALTKQQEESQKNKSIFSKIFGR